MSECWSLSSSSVISITNKEIVVKYHLVLQRWQTQQLQPLLPTSWSEVRRNVLAYRLLCGKGSWTIPFDVPSDEMDPALPVAMGIDKLRVIGSRS